MNNGWFPPWKANPWQQHLPDNFNAQRLMQREASLRRQQAAGALGGLAGLGGGLLSNRPGQVLGGTFLDTRKDRILLELDKHLSFPYYPWCQRAEGRNAFDVRIYRHGSDQPGVPYFSSRSGWARGADSPLVSQIFLDAGEIDLAQGWQTELLLKLSEDITARHRSEEHATKGNCASQAAGQAERRGGHDEPRGEVSEGGGRSGGSQGAAGGEAEGSLLWLLHRELCCKTDTTHTYTEADAAGSTCEDVDHSGDAESCEC